MLVTLFRYGALLYGVLTVIRWILRKRWGSIDKTNEISAKGKIVLITGANTGIGKATALEFAQRDANVILVCRNLESAKDAVAWIRERTALGQLICMQLDLGSLESVRKFCNEFKAKYDRLDILINNAGVLLQPGLHKTTVDGFEVHMGVNHLGHFLLTNLLLDSLKKAAPSRIVTVSSVGHNWAKLNMDDLMNENNKTAGPKTFSLLYCNSKLANALFSKELAKRLQGTGVRTYALCPGVVITDIGRNIEGLLLMMFKVFSPILFYFGKSPQEGAVTTMYCALSKNVINESGQMYQNGGFWDPSSRITLKDEDAARLWKDSEKLVGL